MDLDTFFVATDGPDIPDLEAALTDALEGTPPATPIVGIEEVDGFPPFALPGLFVVLVGRPTEEEVGRHPLLGTVVFPEPPTPPAPELTVRAARVAETILLVGCWRQPVDGDRRRDAHQDQRLLGTTLEVAWIRADGQWLGPPSTARIGRRGLFAVQRAADVQVDRVQVTGTFEGETATAEAALEATAATAERTPASRGFMQGLAGLTARFVEAGTLNETSAAGFLAHARIPGNRAVMDTHPMRLALVVAAWPSPLAAEYGATWSIPVGTTLRPRPTEPVFPVPQARWGHWIAWRLPPALIHAVVQLEEDRCTGAAARWGEVRFQTYYRGSRDLGPPRPLEDVLRALRRLCLAHAAATIWLGWETES